jgi:hypothetical protein
MLFNTNRDSIRKTYHESWKKNKNGEQLNPTEAIVCEVVKEHPEYHKIIEDISKIDQDFTPENGATNPFLHMGLHIAIREQLTTNRPIGIKSIYTDLMYKYQDTSKVEHMIMDYLVEIIITSQKQGTPPDERLYLDNLKKLLK